MKTSPAASFRPLRPAALTLATAMIGAVMTLAACEGEVVRGTSTTGVSTSDASPTGALTAGSSSSGGPAVVGAGSSTGGGSSGGSTSPPASLSGTYSGCSFLLTGGTFESAAFDAASLTLTRNGASVVARYASNGQPVAALQLQATSDTSAILSAPGQGFPGRWGFCGGGENDAGMFGDPAASPAVLSLASATVTTDNGVAILSMTGAVEDIDGGAGCPPDIQQGLISALLVCGTAPPLDAGAPGAAGSTNAGGGALTNLPVPSFVDGDYDCTTDTDTGVTSPAGVEDISNGATTGTLALTHSGTALQATYSGDTLVDGTLDFTLTSAGSANLAAEQVFSVACGVIDPTMLGKTGAPTLTAMNVGSVTTDGTTVFLTALGGSTGATCAGQTSSIAMQCTRHVDGDAGTP